MILCPLGPDQYCARHRTVHYGHLARLAREESAQAEAIRRQWDQSFFTITPQSLRQFDDCQHRGRLLDKSKCGVPVWSCAVHGTCSTARRSGLTLCQSCREYQPPPTQAPEAFAAQIAMGDLPTGWWKRPDVWPAFRLFLQRQIEHHRTQPLPTGQGDGIVMVGGGKYFPAAYCNIRLLRDHGCTLPIELWYFGRTNEMPPKWQALVEPYGVRCIDADAVRQQIPMRIMNGFEVKFYAVAHSSFRRVLFLDADCYPMRAPTFLLHDLRFTAAGAMFWRDTLSGPYEFVKPAVQDMFGIPRKDDWDLETGMFLIDKARWNLPLALTVTLNAYSDLVYQVVYGDKTTPYLAARLTGYEYAISPHAPGGGGWGLWQKWYTGENLFQHRIHSKPVIQPTHFSNSHQTRLWYGLRSEDKLKQYLHELKGQV